MFSSSGGDGDSEKPRAAAAVAGVGGGGTGLGVLASKMSFLWTNFLAVPLLSLCCLKNQENETGTLCVWSLYCVLMS